MYLLAMTSPTIMAEVVHQDDVGEQMWRGAVDDAVHSAKQNGQSLVMKTDDDAGGGEVFGVKLVLLSAPEMELLIQHIRRQAIDHFHITSLPPCWRTITKDSSLASIVSSTNMAATSLSFDSLGTDCKPSIDRLHVTSLPPCWRTTTKDSSLASIVSSSNMAATSFSFDSLGIDCKPSIEEIPKIKKVTFYIDVAANFNNQIVALPSECFLYEAQNIKQRVC